MSRRNPRGSSASRRRVLAQRRVWPRGTSFWDACAKLSETLIEGRHKLADIVLRRTGLTFDEASQSYLPVLRSVLQSGTTSPLSLVSSPPHGKMAFAERVRSLPPLDPCPHCGRIILAGPCCGKAVGSA